MRTKSGNWTIRIELDEIREVVKKLSIDTTKELSKEENIKMFDTIMTFIIRKKNGQTQTATISYRDYIRHSSYQFYYFVVTPTAFKITDNK